MMRFARGSRRLFLLVALVALSSVVYSEARTKQASAAGSSPVVIAVDATSTSACQVTYHLNTRWHSTPPPGAKPLVPWTKTLPCAAGTIIKTAVVPLAQALAQHKRYAPLPAHPQAPTVAERAAIQAVLEAKHTSFASAASAQSAVIAASTCGADNYAYLQWSEQTVGFFSQIWWYTTSDCSTVYLDQGGCTVGWYANYPTVYWYWGADYYYNDVWWLGNGELPPNTSKGDYLDRNEAPGHWYRQDVSWYDTYYGTGGDYDVSVAVLT